MAVIGLLQFTPELGICRNQRFSKQLKYSFRTGELHLPVTNLSSLTWGQNLFTHHPSESIKRPICSIPLRNNALNCHSSSSLGSNMANASLETVTTALTRSYHSLQGNPSIIKLVSAVGVVVFALWGLEPLVRSCRNVFLHKKDNNWRKSTTHYVLTSYLQPALLWMGAMLFCRALDPVVMPTDASHLVKERVLNFVRSLFTVLSFAYCLLCAIQQAQKFFMKTSDPSESRNMGFQFAGRAVHTAAWVAAVSLFMELLGFSAQKWLTAGGLGTVLLTIAGREIFTNFLSSAMIHATRPFVVNEWIQTKIEGNEVSGTVEHVGWWSPTIIRGEDREAVHIPNHKFTVNVVRNLSQKTHWRIKTHLAISHLDVDKINNIVADMRKVLAKNPQVEQQKLHRRVFLDAVNPENQALLILVSCFVKTSRHEEYLRIKEVIMLDLLRVISHHRARLATPIRTIQKMHIDADMENIPFTETAFSRTGAALDRPFLLTDPAKPPRSARSGRDQDSLGMGQQSTSDSKRDAKLKGTSASELKSREALKSGAKVETSNAAAQDEHKGSPTSASATSAPMVDDKQTIKSSTSTSNSDKDTKVADTVVKYPAMTTNLDRKSDPGEVQEKCKVDSSVFTSESNNNKSNVPPLVNPQSKQGEKPSATQPAKPGPALEENIVLGVALEGSKRTLPIDDNDHPSSPPSVETKEAAANQNSSGNGRVTPPENDT